MREEFKIRNNRSWSGLLIGNNNVNVCFYIKGWFEDITVKMPHDYDIYLTRLFGNYMQMPPEDKRINHCPYILDFGDEF